MSISNTAYKHINASTHQHSHQHLLVRITTAPISLKILLKGQLKFMSENGYRVVSISSDGPEVKEITENEKVEHFVIPFTRSITPVQDFRCLLALIRLFRNLKPDIVHTHTPKAGLIGMLAARIAGVPVRFHTVAGMPLMEYKGITQELLQWGERLTYRCATKIFPNSIGLKKFILDQNWVAPQMLKVIGNGSSNGIDIDFISKAQLASDIGHRTSDLDQFKSEVRSLPAGMAGQKSEGLKTNHFVYTFIGRLVRDKGIRELVEAFLSIYETDENTRLILVGHFEDHREPLNGNIKKTIEEHPGIIHVGFQDDIRPWLAMSDVFVFPSYREGFPNVVMQAGAMELPCIVTDIFGSNEIIEDGVNGLIVPSKNAIKLRKAMERLKDDQELGKKLAANARDRIVERYDQKKMWGLILEEYRKVIPLSYTEKVQRGAEVSVNLRDSQRTSAQ